MSVGFQRVIDRCHCIAKVLHSLGNAPQFRRHAENQAMCLQAMIKGCGLPNDEFAQLSVRITELGFPQDVVGSLMESLHVCLGKSKGSRANITLQSWEAFRD